MSETTNLKLKKHDNPSTNEEQFDIENYLNGNWDKIDENVGKVNTEISNIETEKTELEKELKEVQEDFYQSSIRGQASGEYIHVEDSSNCRAKIKISGNSEQETRSGYNLLDMSKAKGGISNGITCTMNDDGSYSYIGTANNLNINVWLLGSFSISAPTLFTLEAGTYYIDGVYLYEGQNAIYQNDNLHIVTFSHSYNITGVRAPSAETGKTYNITRYPIIAKSDKALPWEQFGVSPSPDFTSEIKSVGNNINLFDGSFRQGTHVSLTQANRIISQNVIKSVKGNNYTISTNLSSEYNYKIQNDNTNEIENVNVIDDTSYTSKSSLTIKCTQSGYLKILVNKNDGSSITTDEMSKYHFKVEKGPATLYSKYGQGCVKVTKCNKNIFDKDNITLSEKSYNLDDNGELISQGSWRVVNYIKVKPSTTYTLSGVMVPSKWIHRISEYDAQRVQVKQNQKTFDGFHTFTTSSTTKYIRFNLVSGNNGFDYDLSSIQLEESKKMTTKEQHEEQSYIMPTQKEMLQGDYFDFDNEEEVHTWTKLILTGNENWKLESTGRFGILKSDLSEIPAATSNDNDYLGNMCNSYKESTPALTWKKAQGFCIDMTSCLRIYDDKYSTNNNLEGFKTYLKSKYDAGTPVVIYYKLATPIRLSFTDEQKAVAKELNNARTYKNVTNITTDSKAILDLDYVKDLETLLNNVQALALSNASEGV